MPGTSDGITGEDWDVVKNLCFEILNSVEDDNDFLEHQKQEELFDYLDFLGKKYGERASILATKADYVVDEDAKIVLLQKAFDIAKTNRDYPNLTYIASSLAQTYIEDLGCLAEGQIWLSELKTCLNDFWDKGEAEEMNRLRKIIVDGI